MGQRNVDVEKAELKSELPYDWVDLIDNAQASKRPNSTDPVDLYTEVCLSEEYVGSEIKNEVPRPTVLA